MSQKGKTKEVILVDEAHKFRNHKSQQFENLQEICKSGRENIGGVEDKLDVRSNKALNDLNNWLANQILSSPEAIEAGTNLLPLLKHGTYTNLTNEVYKLRNDTNPVKLEMELIKLSRKYTSKIMRQAKMEVEPLQPKIIISETFV